MLIDYRQLEPDTLHNLLEEIVTRDGTDYGESELSVSEKIANAMQLLQNGSCAIAFDADSETCSLIDLHDYHDED